LTHALPPKLSRGEIVVRALVQFVQFFFIGASCRAEIAMVLGCCDVETYYPQNPAGAESGVRFRPAVRQGAESWNQRQARALLARAVQHRRHREEIRRDGHLWLKNRGGSVVPVADVQKRAADSERFSNWVAWKKHGRRGTEII